MAGREKYKETSDPIRTLQFAFIDEGAELLNAIPHNEGDPYDHENLSEEIGDIIIMSMLIARNQQIPIYDIVQSPTITEFQETYPKQAMPHEWIELGGAIMNVYRTIDQPNSNTKSHVDTVQSLRNLMQEVAAVATTYSIDLNHALTQTIDKLNSRTRENHAIRQDSQPDMPKTHAGRYLLKTGALALADILAAEE